MSRQEAVEYLSRSCPFMVYDANKQPHHEDSREVVRTLLSSIVPPPPTAPQLRNDIESLSRLVRSIMLAADDDIITAEEAKAVIDFIAARFASRRVDEAMVHVFKPRRGSWFQIHGHFQEQR